MNAVRKALCWCLLYAGVASLFIVVFGLTVLAATFLGLYSALAVFVGLVGTITAGITVLFAGDEPEETIDYPNADQWTAPEGAKIVALRRRA
jgi:hypothetical protein